MTTPYDEILNKLVGLKTLIRLMVNLLKRQMFE